MTVYLCTERQRSFLPVESFGENDHWAQLGNVHSDSVYHYNTVQDAVKGNESQENFSSRFFRLVDEKGWTDAEVYHTGDVQKSCIILRVVI